jgi:hypothetical protein
MWLKLKTIERPYFDPRTGKVLSSIEGRRNRPKVDPFTGGGKVYPPEVLKANVKAWQEKGTTLMVLVDDTSKITAAKGTATYQASPKEVRDYDLSEHAPQELDDVQALEALKKDIGLPEGTTLDEDKKPIIPKEIER